MRIIKYSLISGLALLVSFILANHGLCADDISQHIPDTGSQISFHKAVIKFLKAMGGVAISSFIIFAGLTIYNKFFVRQCLDGNKEDDVLKTPHSTDEALTFFIKKNKMK